MTKAKTIKTVKESSIEKMLLQNEKIEEKEVEFFDYEAKDVMYNVTDTITGKTIKVSGFNIETFIGCNNKEAQRKLMSGEKKVETENFSVQDGKFILEIIE